MKILIVDDESLMRISLKTMLSSGGHTEHVVFEAKDGTQALKLITRERPELVFLDIRMPNLDGLRVLQRIRDAGISSWVVMLSSYNEFDMVRQAMRLGADDYIHKPALTQDELLSIVESIESDSKHIRSLKSTSQPQIIALTRRHVMKSLLLGEVPEEFTDTLFIQYFTEFRNSGLICLLLEIKDYSVVRTRYNGNGDRRLLVSLENILAETFIGEPHWMFIEVFENLCVLLFRAEQASESANKAWVSDLTSRAYVNLKQFLNVESSFSVSRRRTLKELPQMFAEARDALEGRYFRPNETLFFVQSFIPGKQSKGCPKIIEDLAELLRQSMINSDFDKSLSVLEDLRLAASRLGTEGLFSSREASALFGPLYFELLEQWNKACFNRSHPAFVSFEQLSSFETFNKLIDSFRDMLSAVRGKAMHPQFSKAGRKTMKALNYIHDNLGKDLSLETVAAYIDLTPSHFSRMFKKDVGLTFSNYLQIYRVEMAANLLRDTELKIYEISMQVGYNNAEYFDRVFLRLKGVTPKEYRRRLKQP